MISGWWAQRARSAKMAAAMMLRGMAVRSSWTIASAPLRQLEDSLRGRVHRGADDLLLLGVEGGEHVIGDVATSFRAAHAHLHPPEILGAQCLDHGAHAVVAARAALDPHAHGAERKVDVVVHEDEI